MASLFLVLALLIVSFCDSFGGTTLSWNSLSTRKTSTKRLSLEMTSSSSSSSSSASAMDGGTQSAQQAIGTPSIVTIDCRLVPEGDFIPEPLIDGVVLHPNDDPVELVFALGLGNYLPGLHALIKELNVGETKTGISLDAGWGSHNPNLVATLSFASVGMEKTKIQIGTQLLLPAQGLTATVTQVADEFFTMDANPPLAGASYAATVTLKSMEQGPPLVPYKETDCDDNETTSATPINRYEVATFALGCFWGGELEFMRVPGVVGTQVGYTQGHVTGPTYKQVCLGTTGHTEAILVLYDSNLVTYEKLVHVAMDRLGENKYLPNQVGNDKGTQYRHGIYYHSRHQREVAKAMVQSYGDDCVTECLPAADFWLAEDYHQQYLLKGGQSARKGDDSTIRCYG